MRMEKTYKDKGKLYNAIHMKKYSDPWISFGVTVLMLFGTLMITSTTAGTTYSIVSVAFKFVKQILFLFLGYLAMIFTNKVFKFNWFYKLQWPLFAAFLIVLLMPFVSVSRGGSNAWISLGPITVQPSEFAKPMMIVLVASALYKAQINKRKWKNFWTLMKGPFIAFLIVEAIVLLQRDLGTAVIIGGITFICMYLPSHPNIQKIQKFVVCFLVGAISLGIFAFGFLDKATDLLKGTPLAHIAVRVENAKDPLREEVIFDGAFQPANALYGIADSNFVGKGIGKSNRKYGYLTQADNDYILAITIEETGIFGFGLIVAMYILIMHRLLYYAFKTKNVAYKVVLAGNATYLFLHFLLNVGGVSALIPMTGIPLLFISNGGSSLLAICATIGISQYCIRHVRMDELKR